MSQARRIWRVRSGSPTSSLSTWVEPRPSVSLCLNGETPVRRDIQLGYFQFKSPAVDVHSVGAGGGSIAFVSASGALQVGPSSAGADPGPAAYGRGEPRPSPTRTLYCTAYRPVSPWEVRWRWTRKRPERP